MASSVALIDDLTERLPCRDAQIRTLATLLGPDFPTPPSLVIHGLEATGKSTVTRSVLAASQVPHAVIDSRECITGRHLLEQTATACRRAAQKELGTDTGSLAQARCETLNTLQAHLEKSLKGLARFVLVFDGVDAQKEAPYTLMAALVRFGLIIPNLTAIFVVSVPGPRLFHLPGIPHIHFNAYNKDESVRILSKEPLDIFDKPIDDDTEDYGLEEAQEDKAWLWPRYCAVVWDSIAKSAARDLRSFRLVCHKLWPAFVQPIVDGTFGTRDFTKLLVHRRVIFQDEWVLTGKALSSKTGVQDRQTVKGGHELPYYTKYLLCAAYLASYNPARLDPIFFMKNTERKKRKRGGAPAGRASKHRKIPRHLLNPSPFQLDRLLAILHSILPHSMVQTGQIAAQIATLTSLRLLLRTGGASADPLDPSSRFRVNCSWEYVSTLGRSVNFEMRDFLAT